MHRALTFAMSAAVTILLAHPILAGKEADPMHVLSLAFDKIEWRFTSRGKYLLVRDPRGLYQVFHPWDTSEDGDFGAISARGTIPAGWRGPVFLNLYANDTYQAEGWEEARAKWTHSYAACHQLVGHRFKQVLIDGKVVWDQDCADSESFGYTSIDIAKHVKPGKAFELTLRVIDKVSPATKLPGDEFKLGIWDWQAQRDKDADKKFYTRVFWGDVAISSGEAVAWDKNPARRETPFDPIKPVAAKPATRGQGTFVLSAPGGLPEDSYPVTWGVPFAQGLLLDEKHVALADPSGQPTPLQTRVLRRWPDGSIHWLLLDFQAGASGAEKPLTLTYGTEVAPTPAREGLSVTQTGDRVTVNTGALAFAVTKGANALAEAFTLAGETQPIGEKLTGVVGTRDGWTETQFEPVSENVTVEASGPERATVLVAGKLVSGDKAFGRFTCRIHAYRGQPFVRVLFRVFNDTDVPAQLVNELSVRLETPMETGEAVIGDQTIAVGPAENERLLVRQSKCDAYKVFDGSDAQKASGQQWSGPITLRTPEHGVSGAVRHFAPLYPKRMWAGAGGQMAFDLFASTIEYEQYVMTRGEAKRHELLIYFHDGRARLLPSRASRAEEEQLGKSLSLPDVAAACAAFEKPPMLVSAEWYGSNQAFGRGAPLTDDRFPDLHKRMTGWAPKLDCYQPLGIRNWPDSYSDSVYSAYRGTWTNMYQEQNYGCYIVGLLTGKREWIDYVQAYEEHFMDIDICHYHPDPKYVGACYGVSPNHTGHQPYALNAPLGGLFTLHYLTGDPDGREAAIGIADWVHGCNLGMGAGSGRAVGWPLRSAAIAYENTGDAKYLEAAKRLAEFALHEATPRRGFFSEPTTAWQYRGGVPGMNSILMAGLMRYWRASGDERVGRLCADIAHNMAYSWMSPVEPGLILGNSPLQQVYVTGYAMQDILPLFWGYELTGDRAFLEKGAQMMQASILDEKQKGAAFGLARYWELQDMLYYYDMTDAGR